MFGFKKEKSKIDWQLLSNEEQLQFMNKASIEKPVVLFKHSTSCSISNVALKRFEKNYDKKIEGKAHFYLLDILNHRDISNEISQMYGVKHESPQMLIIQSGICTIHESHFDISFNNVIVQLIGN